MDLENRIGRMVELGRFMQSDAANWQVAKTRASQHNAWFIPAFIDRAVDQIVQHFLQPELLEQWALTYELPAENKSPKTVGIVMAGNIPLVGFHDFLCSFLSGHRQVLKLSSRDPYLFPAIIQFLTGTDPAFSTLIQTDTMLKGLDAYIATGSNNSARYFDYYFGKYPSLIRRNRTSVAFLDGNESAETLDLLADDVFLYFGLGCRNVTQIHVPAQYDFVPLLNAFRKYLWMADHNKYKNNYDYRLSLAILNKLYYMTNECILLLENESPFSAISVLQYQYYRGADSWVAPDADSLQAIIGKNFVPFGKSQQPGLTDYPDGADTMQFLLGL